MRESPHPRPTGSNSLTGFLQALLRYVPFLAILFAGLYYYRIDLTAVDFSSLSLDGVAASMLVLVASFVVRAHVWRRLLRRNGVEIGLLDAAASQFKPILAKYLPGKVWTLVGTAGMLREFAVPIRRGMVLVSWFQILLLIAGAVVGCAGLLFFGLLRSDSEHAYLAAPAVVGLCLFLLSRHFVRDRVRSALAWAAGGEQVGGFQLDLGAMLASVLHWLLLGAAYWIFLRAAGFTIGAEPVLLQPLANLMGMVAGFAPGGLGVREAFTALYLRWAGMDASGGLAAAVLARLWFLVVEVGLFAVGLWLAHGRRRRPAAGA